MSYDNEKNLKNVAIAIVAIKVTVSLLIPDKVKTPVYKWRDLQLI